uniref:Uncharacterized protein n=1 Tax=Glossina brevipalpis TaxID=37001 RepID=A0A1A9WJS1_9MUSC
MHNSNYARQQYANIERRFSKRSEKAGKLDRKSSRGMIYENEELRLRTININAEVERGQSDIKRLKKENELLRREIWILRDECDRLNKKVKAKFLEHDQGACGIRCSGASTNAVNERQCCCSNIEGGEGGARDCGCETMMPNNYNSEDSDSCTGPCCCADDEDDDDAIEDVIKKENPINEEDTRCEEIKVTTSPTCKSEETKSVFDHLSVVSEETLSHTEHTTIQQNENLFGYTPDIYGSETTLPSFVGPLTPLTPIELVANELSDLQATVPPLSYFENIVSEHLNSRNENTRENISLAGTEKSLVRHTNGWDYNLQSPFAQKRSTAQTLSTFQPTSSATAITTTSQGVDSNAKTIITTISAPQQTETVAIVTVSTLDHMETPKHFFAPLRPKLKLNTALANQRCLPASSMLLAATSPTSFNSKYLLQHEKRKCEPPDLYVTNGLATPYRCTKTCISSQPPPVPQRKQFPVAQVSPRSFRRKNQFQQQHYEHRNERINGAGCSLNNTSYRSSRNNSLSINLIENSGTDSINLEAILNDIEAISEDILTLQLKKDKSIENLNRNSLEITENKITSLQQTNKNNKPYKSEMNLLLTYDGDTPIIKPTKSTNLNTTASFVSTMKIISEDNANNCKTLRRTRSLEKDRTNSPSPNMPDAMPSFPDNREYLSIDRLSKEIIKRNTLPSVAATATQTLPVINTPQQDVDNILSPMKINAPADEQNPACKPLIRMHTSPPELARSYSATNPPSHLFSDTNNSKNPIYSTLVGAAAKRALFRSAPTHITKSLDTDPMSEDDNCIGNEIDNHVETVKISDEEGLQESTDIAKRKARRVSIVCGDSNNANLSVNMPAIQSQNPDINTLKTTAATTTNSCCDLPSITPNPTLNNLKQISHSTPNSPHSVHKHEETRAFTKITTPTILKSSPNTLPFNCTSDNSTPHYEGCVNATQSPRKSNHDTIRATASEIACAAANVMRSKCARRHSDGTVAHNNQRASAVSTSTTLHHHHNHHHHQHSSSLTNNINTHRSHHMRQDSNHEVTIPCSERNSNSLASSRESSTSFSMRSQRRKLSVSSHTGGKIPWCACWGNGCL